MTCQDLDDLSLLAAQKIVKLFEVLFLYALQSRQDVQIKV